MQEQLKIKCCNKPVSIERDAEIIDTKEKGVGVWCETCGLKSFHEDEKTAHIIYLDAYYIDKYPVTNAQYRKFMAATSRLPSLHLNLS